MFTLNSVMLAGRVCSVPRFESGGRAKSLSGVCFWKMEMFHRYGADTERFVILCKVIGPGSEVTYGRVKLGDLVFVHGRLGSTVIFRRKDSARVLHMFVVVERYQIILKSQLLEVCAGKNRKEVLSHADYVLFRKLLEASEGIYLGTPTKLNIARMGEAMGYVSGKADFGVDEVNLQKDPKVSDVLDESADSAG